MHDTATCRRSSPLATSTAAFDVLQLSPVASGSTSAEELQFGGVPFDDDNGDTDESSDDDEEDIDFFIELLMDPLSRSLSCPAETGAGSEYPSLMGLDDQDIPSFPVFDEPTSSALRTASAATASAAAGAQEMDLERLALLPDPHGRKTESSLTGGTTRTAARSRSLPATYVEPAECPPDTETWVRSDTIEIDDRTAARQMSTTSVTQSQVADIPLLVRTLIPSDSDNEDD